MRTHTTYKVSYTVVSLAFNETPEKANSDWQEILKQLQEEQSRVIRWAFSRHAKPAKKNLQERLKQEKINKANPVAVVKEITKETKPSTVTKNREVLPVVASTATLTNSEVYELFNKINFKGADNIGSWLILSGITKGGDIFKAIEESNRVDKSLVFGGLKNYQDFVAGRITKKEWEECRRMQLYCVGEAMHSAQNRHFKYDIETQTVTYWREGKAIALFKLNPSNRYANKLRQAMTAGEVFTYSIGTNEMSITVPITQSGFTVKKVPAVSSSNSKETPEEMYKKALSELTKTKKLVKQCRYLAYDQNPNSLGWAICDYRDNGVKVVVAGIINLSELTKKSGRSITHEDSKYLTNKREYEMYETTNHLIRLARRHHCDGIVAEKLTIGASNKGKGKGFNRLVNNVWPRSLFASSMQKLCLEKRLEYIEVNSAYSSFLGNALDSLGDPVSPAIELARRVYEGDEGQHKNTYSWETLLIQKIKKASRPKREKGQRGIKRAKKVLKRKRAKKTLIGSVGKRQYEGQEWLVPERYSGQLFSRLVERTARGQIDMWKGNKEMPAGEREKVERINAAIIDGMMGKESPTQFGDKPCTTWLGLYEVVKKVGLQYHSPCKETIMTPRFSFNSPKSKVTQRRVDFCKT